MTMSNPAAVAFGEVLFDRFEDRDCLGGAPLNFAWYLRQLGVRVAVLSAVGPDELGAQVVRVLREAGIVPWLADRAEPTGTTDVRLQDGEPEFSINPDTAWEHIEFPAELRAAPELLYFGTVAQKWEANRATLARLLELDIRHRFYDANLRPFFRAPEVVLEGLRRATVVKLSGEEWEEVSRLVGEDAPGRVAERFGIEALAVTRGDAGAELHVRGACHRVDCPTVEVVDTVGAGDAFSAVLAAGVMRGADPRRTLRVACDVGTFVVQHRGAQVDLPEDLRAVLD